MKKLLDHSGQDKMQNVLQPQPGGGAVQSGAEIFEEESKWAFIFRDTEGERPPALQGGAVWGLAEVSPEQTSPMLLFSSQHKPRAWAGPTKQHPQHKHWAVLAVMSSPPLPEPVVWCHLHHPLPSLGLACLSWSPTVHIDLFINVFLRVMIR